MPPPGYSFEILKTGIIVSNITIKSSFLVFGGLESCDVVLEHPSSSRFHAVLQYCRGDETHQKGFYLYDLGSTHGTFLNKEKIQAKIYYQVKVGHIIRFGGSSRMFIFQGPEEDPIVEQSVKKVEEEECSWGISEDAEEEDDLEVNPFALSTENEDLYLDDPKKTLRGWFEREGYDLEYSVEEKGFRTFSCKVLLPVDSASGESVYAEASVTGKKKEAVIACALEACRILDRRGLLRQAQHESKKKKRKNWEEDDFYDSDEDTYLDRTGAIEKKREIRKKLVSKPEIETHQTLTEKLGKIVENINDIKRKLHDGDDADVRMKRETDDVDSLEVFMSQIESPSHKSLDKVTISRLRLELSSLEKEKERLEKLVKITKPACLPPLLKSNIIIGKIPKKKLCTLVTKPIPKSMKVEVEIVEEEDDDEEEMPVKQDTNISSSESKMSVIITEEECDNKGSVPFKKNTEEAPTPFLGPKKEDYFQNLEAKKEKKVRKPKKEADVYKANDEGYSMWVPPNNQAGDGKTHLNDKFGY